MFFAIKASTLKMLRTLPTIWINFVNEVPHCWIPKTGYSYKMKNLAQPPNETDIEARKEWFFVECEILFEKAFNRLTDGEMALSKLNYGPEWFINYNETKEVLSSEKSKCKSTENVLSSNETAITSKSVVESSERSSVQTVLSGSESSSSTSQVMDHSRDKLTSNVSEDYSADSSPFNVIEPDHLLNKSSEHFTPSMEQYTVTGSELSSNKSSSISCVATRNSSIQPDNLVTESGSSLSEVMSLFVSTGSVVVTENFNADNSELPSSVSISSSVVSLNEQNETSTPFEEQDAATELLSNERAFVSSALRNQDRLIQPDLSVTESNTSSSESMDHSVSTVSIEVTENCKISEIPIPHPKVLSDLDQYIENKRVCQVEGFPRPIHYKKFANMQWMWVRTVINDLQPGNKFKTLEELSIIPRRYAKPFCRPGPLKRGELYDWYLVDSIVQKVYLKSAPTPFFVVRWVGYEDEYNTVEPLSNVKHTAVYELYTSPKLYTACRLNGCILRRSERKVLHKVVPTVQTVSLKLMDIEPRIYERAMNKLIAELRIEEEAGRYSPYFGFCSKKSSSDAILAQHKFIIEKFCLLIHELDSPVCLDEHYIGPIFGTLGRAAEFVKVKKDGKIKVVQNAISLENYITRGLSINSKMSKHFPRYVSFIVQRKFDTAEKHDMVQLNFHMSVFTVRSNGSLKDAVHYDPSPKYFAHKLQPVLDELTKPVLESFTHKFGNASEKDDCTFQCMRYIIGLATGEVSFEPDLSEPCRKIDKLMVERASKRMKLK